MRVRPFLSSAAFSLVASAAQAQAPAPIAPPTTSPAAPAAQAAPADAAAVPAQQSDAESAADRALPPARPPAESGTIEVAPTPPQIAGAPDEPLEEEKGGKKDKKKKKKPERRANLLGDDAARFGKLEIGGRVFARAELNSRKSGDESNESLDLVVPSARLDVKYETPIDWLSLNIEFDVAGNNPEMKDAYVDARGRHFFARAGQFKPPISAFEMESPWTLPLADRGFLHDLLLDYLDVAGRRPGVLVGWRGRGGIKPRISVGAFQGSTLRNQNTDPGDRDVDLIEERDLEAQGLAARFDVDLGDLELGVFFQHRVGAPRFPETKHYPVGGADLVWDQTFANGGIRVWFDAMVGTSWYEHLDKEPDNDDAVFASGRLLAGYRFGGTMDEAFYVEPFGMFALLDPDLDFASDFAWEGVAGVNVGFWRRARLTLQAEINEGDKNFPNHTSGYLFGQSPDRLGAMLQGGIAF